MTRKEFEKAVECARPRLIIRALKRLGGDAAEDAVQDALIIALQKSDWETVVNVENWLLGVVDNVINNLSRTTRYADVLDDNAARAGSDLVDEIAENDEKAQQVAVIMDAASRAGLTRREDYIFLARLRGLTHAEIADQMGSTESVVSKLYSRALGKIRTELGEIK